MSSIKQFKLTNDDEIICEVLQFNDEENDAMIIRGALRIVNVEDFSRGVRFYAFRPWMGFSDDPELLQTLNAVHIICEADPSKDLLTYYANTLAKLRHNEAKKHMPLDEIAKQSEEMDEEEFEAFLDDYIQKQNVEVDSASPNIIQFKPKGTFH